jgi:hypothetical protein
MKSKESKPPSRKEIEFDAALLLESLRDHADHLAFNSRPQNLRPRGFGIRNEKTGSN